WRRWPDDDQRRFARAGSTAGVAGEDGAGGPGAAGGPTGEAGSGLRGRSAASDLEPRGQGGPQLAGSVGAVASRRTGAARGAADSHVVAVVGIADGSDAGELRLRVPASGAASQAGDAG